MIVVARLDRDTVERTVSDLIRSGELEKAFDGPYPID
jgi:hypothetical protein